MPCPPPVVVPGVELMSDRRTRECGDSNTGGREEVFDQNRVYLALAYQITHDLCLHTGFLWQIFSNRTFRRLQFALFFNPDLR